MTLVGVGVALTLVVTAVLYLVWGTGAVLPGAAFGLVATGLQVAAAKMLPTNEGEFASLVGRWGMGVGLRLCGVMLVGIAVLVDRVRFPPLPTAFGFLGVMIPLLFLELRRLR